MYRLLSPTRSYAWGSRSALADLLGRPAPGGEPEAELWIGAHPAAPSLLVRPDGTRVALHDAIDGEAEEMLGAAVAAAGAGLPFLLKVLAVEHPLSLQVHPDRTRAAAGFAAEERAGLPRDHAGRTFRDANHKPELICALTPFDALCGLRPEPEIIALLDELAIPQLKPAVDTLVRVGGADGLRELLDTILRAPDPADLVAGALDSARRHRDDSPWAASYDCAFALAERFPGDPGVVVSLLLNLVHLRPGEAMYLPPGRLHAYLSGVGVELMACSDNVLRGGLTPKHVDVDRLLDAAELHAGPIDIAGAHPDASGWCRYRVPVPDFELARTRLTGASVISGHDGPQILLCLEGGVDIGDGTTSLHLARGESVFVPAGRELTVHGTGCVVRATTGDPSA